MRPLTLTAGQARRLFVLKQRLTPAARPASILDVVRSLRSVQLDPIDAVARSHRLVIWSRLGPYDGAALDRLLWRERALFEYWAHCASIVLTEDYPIHQARMRSHLSPKPPLDTVASRRSRAWVAANAPLRRFILDRLARHGPHLSRALEESGHDPSAWVSVGWTTGRNISRMLDHLWISGRIMVTERRGGQKVWDLTERVLPPWAPRERLGEPEVTRRAIEHSIRALGVGTERHLKYHFVRGRYPGFTAALARLLASGRLVRVAIPEWPGEWFIHADDVELLDRTDSVADSSRVALLSPFDNLIADRARTTRMFDFDFRIEIYVPPAERRFGYYVLPILQGDRLIGRIDPAMDRDAGRLSVNAVYAEPDASKSAGRELAVAVESLARFLGATSIRYDRRRVPGKWRSSL